MEGHGTSCGFVRHVKESMKKWIHFLLIGIMTAGIWAGPWGMAAAFGAEAPQITGAAAVLIDSRTGKVLYDKNMHEAMHPASTTKMTTAILALEKLRMDQVLIADKDAVDVEPTKINMKEGEQFTVEQLVNVMLIRSANDTAVVLAKAMGGDIANFAAMMNAKAEQIGTLNTNFVNPNGFTHEEHLTTAYDLAQIARYAMENPAFREIVQKPEYTIGPTNLTAESRTVKNTNELTYNIKTFEVDGKLVSTRYEGATGVKTGSTQKAGRCFVGSAMKDGRELICVVLRSDDENISFDTIKLLDYGFDNFENHTVISASDYSAALRVKSADVRKMQTLLAQDAVVTIGKGTLAGRNITVEEDLPAYVTAPVSQGAVMGTYSVYVDGVLEQQIDILAAEDIPQSSWLHLGATLLALGGKAVKPVLVICAAAAVIILLYAVLAVRLARRRAALRRRSASLKMAAGRRRSR